MRMRDLEITIEDVIGAIAIVVTLIAGLFIGGGLGGCAGLGL
ncbi:hypothetical protein [Paenirhodobacter sp. CAU 1674]|nr:hypothetical protein [Paenirhodobacter sp. CAU 1674]MDF2141212.1 hypothetical protein [Paenirhodobacter sp. CAU 1674]